MKLRVGLIGLGQAWESRHLPALRTLSDRFEVRAVCAEVSHRAQQAAAQFEASAVDGFRALINREDIDAILMLAPQWYGPLPILAACDAGKAVYSAAAMDLTIEQARTVRERVERSGIAFVVEFPRRLAPATIRLKELIATKLGHPRLVFCHHRLLFSARDQKPCRNDASPVTRNLLELVDWCHYVVGTRPRSVIGVEHPGAADRGEYRMMSLEFAPLAEDRPAPLAQISCGHYLPAAWPEAITFRPPAALQVSCDRGVAFVDLPSSLVWFDEAGRHLESLEEERPVGEQLLVQFHRAVTSLVRKTTDIEDAYLALNIVLAAQANSCGHKYRLTENGT